MAQLFVAVLAILVLSVSSSPTKKHHHRRVMVNDVFPHDLSSKIHDSNSDLKPLEQSSTSQTIDSSEGSYHICNTTVCSLQAQSLHLSMDTFVDPCEDFYDHVCGGWSQFWTAYMKSKDVDTNVIGFSQALLHTQVQKILTANSEPTDIKSLNAARTIYRSCLYAESEESMGTAPLIRTIIERNGGWPVAMTPNDRESNNFEWQKIERTFNRLYESHSFNEILIQINDDDSRAIYIRPESSRVTISMLLNETAKSEYREQIIGNATLFARLEGHNVSRSQIEEDATNLIEFEFALLEILNSTEDDDGKMLTINELQRKYDDGRVRGPNAKINWLKTVQSRFLDSDLNIDGDETLTVSSVEYLLKLAELLDRTTPKVIVNYVFWSMINHVRDVGGKYFDDMPKEASKRSFYCASRSLLPLAISYEFGRQSYVDEATHIAISKMITKLQKEIGRQISQSTWLSESTKKTLKDKLFAMKKLIGFSGFNLTEEFVTRHYEGLRVTDDYAENILNVIEWYTTKYLLESRLVRMMDEAKFQIEINAFYEFETNTMYIPPWIIKFSMISPVTPEYISLATVGSIIGHEIMHGFGEYAITLDKDAIYFDWEDSEDDEFKRRTNCYVSQYNNYTVPELSSPSKLVHADGLYTLEENMADAGGLNAAFEVFKRDARGKPVNTQRLPGFEKISTEKLFFLSFGKMWCARESLETVRLKVRKDPHSVNHVRVNGVISNSKEFGRVFGCPIDSKMNPERKCNLLH